MQEHTGLDAETPVSMLIVSPSRPLSIVRMHRGRWGSRALLRNVYCRIHLRTESASGCFFLSRESSVDCAPSNDLGLRPRELARALRDLQPYSTPTNRLKKPGTRHTRSRHTSVQHNTSKPAIPQADARFRKHPRKKHMSGIASNGKPKPAIPDVDARFRKHLLKKQINGSKPKPANSHVDARFCDRPLKKHISGIAANSKSTPAIPRVNARVRKHQLETQVATHKLSKLKERPCTVMDRAETTDWMGKHHMIEVLKISPNPAVHGVGATLPRPGRLKPTASTTRLRLIAR